MPVLAKLVIQEERTPLSDEDRAMIIRSLREFIVDLSPNGRLATKNVHTMYIHAPELYVNPPKEKDGKLR